MKRLRSSAGQLSLPILAVLLFFTLFICLHARRSLQTYRQMRLDVTADLVALSSARTAAQMFNTMASTQILINAFLQKAAVFGEDYGHMQVSARNGFEALHALLEAQNAKFEAELYRIALIAAKMNGCRSVPIPLTPHHLKSYLKGKDVHVAFFAEYIPVGGKTYRNAYYVREWEPQTLRAQPNHTHIWVLTEHSYRTKGKAQMWLDIPPNAVLHNGGFPPPSARWWEGVGIQCKLPHFNARLMPRSLK